jgi:uncharacterized membrane protein
MATNANPKSAPSSDDARENQVWGIIAYLGILFLVPLLGKKDSPFAQYHAKQGLALTVVWFIGLFIPLVNMVMWAVFVVFMILGILNAVNGKMNPLPVIGSYAEKLSI